MRPSSDARAGNRRAPIALAAAAAIAVGGVGWAVHSMGGNGKTQESQQPTDTGAAVAPPTTSSPSTAASTIPVANGCLGGRDLALGAQLGRQQASTSTLTQDGVQVPSPAGAAAAAASFARLRATLPAVQDREAAMREILAPDATAAAKAVTPAAAGWIVNLDMAKARWRVVSGDGQTAGIEMLLTSVGSKDGKAVTPVQSVVHMDLVLQGGQWRLKDLPPARSAAKDFAGGQVFTNLEECGR